MTQHVLGKLDSRVMRAMNLSLLLDIIRHGGRVSRTDLARRSSLTKATVSTIVEDLLERGIVQEVGYGKTFPSGGRRAKLLEFNQASEAYLGIRIGTETTTLAVADALGEIRATREMPLIPGDPRESLLALREWTKEALQEAGFPEERLRAAGVTAPGLVDGQSGRIAFAQELEWVNVPIRDIVQGELGVPVVVNNMANAGAIAELHAGAAKGASSLVWLYIGECVGAGIIVGGRPISGHTGFKGELGHFHVHGNELPCSCGLQGCLDAVASIRALVHAARMVAHGPHPTTLRDHQGPLDFETLVNAATAGDALAKSLFQNAAECVGLALSYVINLLGPEKVVLGGRVVEQYPELLDVVRATAARHSLCGFDTQIVSSTLGASAGVVGAVSAALELSLHSAPATTGS